MGTTIKHRLSTVEGFAIIASYYEQGGQGAKQFYTAHGLTENQFYRWRKRYNRAHPDTAPVSATGARIRPLQITAAPLPCSLEIEYANGNRLRLPCGEGFSLALVTQLLQVTT
ncbi:MAG: hypothetical protein LBO74_01220 [Candidatus Symbiothrix sp.]|jgi:transposase-like protein|nr:hypothetical protein [Candidatus Symbiothrix sp.]